MLPHRFALRVLVGVASTLMLTADKCYFTHDEAGPDSPTEPRLIQVSEASVTGSVGEQKRLVVLARTAAGPVAGVTVRWGVGLGGGSLSTDQSTTDGEGHASTVWTLGPVEGTQAAAAYLRGQHIDFVATVSSDFEIVPAQTAIVGQPGCMQALSLRVVAKPLLYSSAVSLDLSESPPGVHVVNSPITIAPPFTSSGVDVELELEASEDAPLVVSQFRVRGSSATKVRLSPPITYELRSPVCGFSLSAPLATPVILRPDFSAPISISIERAGTEVAGPVTLSASAPTPELTATFTPNPALGASATAQITASAHAAPGTYNMVIHGKAGGLERTVTIKVVVVTA